MSDAHRTAEEIFRAFVDGLADGEDLDVDELCERHPEHAAELQERYQEWRAIAEALAATAAETREPTPLERPHWRDFVEQVRSRGPTWTRFEELGEVARGGMGSIHKVYDRDLRRPLALKRMRRDTLQADCASEALDSFYGRFIEEAQITGQLDHPGIVSVHEIGVGEDGEPYFAMELVRGEDLGKIYAKVRARTDGWNQARALNVLQRVCEAMSYAHAQGVVHRDLKPANVMVGNFGETYVMDWGLARVIGDSRAEDEAPDHESAISTEASDPISAHSTPALTMDGAVMGTPLYMAPEQAQGRGDLVGPKADVFAVGAMLYELLAGSPPYLARGQNASPRTVLSQVIQREPDRLASCAPDTSPELIAICEKAMARDLDARYAGMAELGEDLRAYLENRVVQAYRSGALVELVKWVQRNRGVAVASVLAILTLVAGMVSSWLLYGQASTAALNERKEREKATELLASSWYEHGREALFDDRPMEALAYLHGSHGLVDSPLTRRVLRMALARLEQEELRVETDAWSARPVVGGERVLARRLRSAGGGGQLMSASTGELIHAFDAKLYLDSPRDRVLAWRWDQVVEHWNLATATLENTWTELGQEPTYLAFSRDGSKFVVCDDKGVRVISWDTGEVIASLELANVSLAEFSPDGESLAIAHGARDIQVDLWPVTLTEAKLTFDEDRRGGILSGFVFGPEGRFVVIHRSSSYIEVRDLESGLSVKGLRHDAVIERVMFSESGILVTAAANEVKIWGRTGLPLAQNLDVEPVLITLRGVVNDVKLSHDQGQLVIACSDRVAEIWTLRGEHVATLIGHSNAVRSASFLDDERRVVTCSADGSWRIWRPYLGDLRKVEVGELRVSEVRNFPHDDRIAGRGWHNGSSTIWVADPKSGGVCFEEPVPDIPLSVEVSPGGDRVLVCCRSDATVRIFGVRDGALLQQFKPGEGVPRAAFTPDGESVLAVAHPSQEAVLWSARTGERKAALVHDQSPSRSVAISPDGRIAATTGSGEATLWDLAEQRQLGFRTTAPSDYTEANIEFSPDSRKLITTLRSSAVLCSIETFDRPIELKGHSSLLIGAIFSSSSDRALTFGYDGIAILWDAESGRELVRLEGHVGYVVAADFSPDDALIATLGEDGSVRAWDGRTGRPVAVARVSSSGRFSYGAVSVEFDRTGTELTVAFGGDLHVWNLAPEERSAEELDPIVEWRTPFELVDGELARRSRMKSGADL